MSSYSLLGTSPDLDSARRLISEYFFGAKIYFEELEPGVWSVSNSVKLLPAFRVVKRNNRFRFEANK